MRSWLIIEADNDRKLSKAPMVGADAVVIDLAHIPANHAAEAKREEIAEWLRAHADPLSVDKAFARWVMVKPLDAPLWREDLTTIMKGAPDGVILPKTSGPDQIRMLASELYEIEQKLGLKHNSTKIIPQIGETPHAALALETLTSDPQPRLTGFTWNATNLARRMGAKRTHDVHENWTGVFAHVRTMTLLLAKAMGVMAIETATSEESDMDICLADAQAANYDGFTGMFATRPRHISAINEAYSVSCDARAEADALISQFAAQKEAHHAVSPPQPVPETTRPDLPEPQKFRAVG